MSKYIFISRTLLAVSALLPAALRAQDAATATRDSSVSTARCNLHFQFTYIYQYKPAFNSLYSGPNSLGSEEERQNSFTSTLFFGARMWKGAEIYVNPEVAGGSGLSGAFGMAASTNGETFRVGDPAPTLYLARGFFAQTFPLGKATTVVAEAPNETGGRKPADYVKFIIGKISLGDIFDNNTYAASPRTQFMNWCLMSNGAWDYAANLRGYTYAFAAVMQKGSWAGKAALATLPTVANGPELNTDLSQEYSLNAQLEKSYKLRRRTGALRLLGYYNNGNMGNYAQAMQDAGSGTLPNVIGTRRYGRSKSGVGLNAEQQLNDYAGVFARLGWNDGQDETWCFTEADQVASAGVSIMGDKWHRKNDVLGFAFDINALSANHRNYLAAGGLGFQLGDTRLAYAHESVLELFYSYKPCAANIWLSADYQFVLNPGYNADRGPVNVFAIRVHTEL